MRFFFSGGTLTPPKSQIFNSILEKSLLNKKCVFLHLNQALNLQNVKKCILGGVLPKNVMVGPACLTKPPMTDLNMRHMFSLL